MSRRSNAGAAGIPVTMRYSSAEMMHHLPSVDQDYFSGSTTAALSSGSAAGSSFSGKRRVSLLDSKELEVLNSLLGKSGGINLNPEQLKPQKLKVNFSNLTTKCFNEPDSDHNISSIKKDGGEFFEIFGATPVKIVEKMTLEGFLDSEFLTDFLQSFRAFMEPIDLLHIIMLRLQWTQEQDHTSFTPKQLETIQKKTLQTLQFWSEQHSSDFQNIEITTKIRFHFEMVTSSMRSAECAIIYEELQRKFGLKGKKKKRMSVTVSVYDVKVLEMFGQTSFFNLAPVPANNKTIVAPAVVTPEEAKVEKVNKQNRPRSSTTRWLSSPLRRESKEKEQPMSFFGPSTTPSSAASTPPHSPTSGSPPSAPFSSSSSSSSSTSSSSSSQAPSSSSTASHTSGSSSHSPSKLSTASTGSAEKQELEGSHKKRSSRSQSISQRVSRFGHSTKRISRTLVGSHNGDINLNRFLMETKSTVLVEQLCLLEQKLHRDIPKQELSDLGWTKRKKGNEARAVMAVIVRFNEFSRWVAYEILKGPTPDQRAKVIEKFIRISDKCLKENNLSTVMQIELALQRQEVYNLKKTWNYVGSYEKEILRRMREFTTPVRNFKNVREHMEAVTDTPAVPFLGLYLSDMVFNAELPNTTTSDQMINVNKFRNKGNIVRRALKFSSLPPYPHAEDLRVQGKLTLLPFSTETDIEKLSKTVD